MIKEYELSFRVYDTDGVIFSIHDSKHVRLEVARMYANGYYDNYHPGGEIRTYSPRRGLIINIAPILRTNISIRDLSTGRFVKWKE